MPSKISILTAAIVPLRLGEVNLQHDLFQQSTSDSQQNALPDCMAYRANFMTSDSATNLYQYLSENVNWQQPTVRVWGQDHKVPRLQFWMGETGKEYQYSGKLFKAAPWLPIVEKLKLKVERTCGMPYNSVLLNWYRDGQDKMGWHADNEEELGPSPTIAMVSLGAKRSFQFKHLETQVTENLEMDHGSLLLMKQGMQETYHHQVPTRAKVSEGRISLTFRNIIK